MSKRRAVARRNGATSTQLETTESGVIASSNAVAAVVVEQPRGDCVICCAVSEGSRGKLPCAHGFCFECIQAWSKVNNSCPLCKAVFHSIDVEGAVKKRSLHVKDAVPQCEYEVADYPEERYGDARMYLQIHQDVTEFIRGVNFIGFGLSRYNEELDDDYELDDDDDVDDDDDDERERDSNADEFPLVLSHEDGDDDDEGDDGIVFGCDVDPFDDDDDEIDNVAVALRAPSTRGRPVPLRRSTRARSSAPAPRPSAIPSRAPASRRAAPATRRASNGRLANTRVPKRSRRSSGSASAAPPPSPPPSRAHTRVLDLVDNDDDDDDDDEDDGEYCASF